MFILDAFLCFITAKLLFLEHVLNYFILTYQLPTFLLTNLPLLNRSCVCYWMTIGSAWILRFLSISPQVCLNEVLCIDTGAFNLWLLISLLDWMSTEHTWNLFLKIVWAYACQNWFKLVIFGLPVVFALYIDPKRGKKICE